MKYLSKLLIITLAFLALFAVPLSSVGAALTPKDAVCQGVGSAGGSCDDKGTGVNGIIKVVVDVLSTLVGVVAVIMIIIGGFKYITSSGDTANVQSAKNTILFAIVGLVIVAMAQVITGFVLNKVT